LEDHPKIKQVLNGEEVLWAGRVTQLAGIRSKEPKVRVLIVSNSAIYKVRAENLGKVSRRIVMGELNKITYNLGNNQFILRCAQYDYMYTSLDCRDIVHLISKAKREWCKARGLQPPKQFLINTRSSATHVRQHLSESLPPPQENLAKISSHDHKLRPPPPKVPSRRGREGRVAHLRNLFDSEAAKIGEINPDLAVSLKEQTANFRMCFCVAGYRMCTHVHPQFEVKSQSSRSGDTKSTESAGCQRAPPPLPTSSLGQSNRRRKPVKSANMAAAEELRAKNAVERGEQEAKDEVLNQEALDRLLLTMGEVRRKGIIYLRSKFLMDPESYLKSQGPLSHNRQVRKARSEQKKNYTNLNPAIDQFLQSVKDTKLIRLAGLKLLESVYNLPKAHLKHIQEPVENIEDHPLKRARNMFRKIAEQIQARKYDLQWRIGQGAFGSVYMARPLPGRIKKAKPNTCIAVKSIDLSGEEDLAEINKEIEALAEGEICPQLVQYYGCATVDRYLMLAMELMDGSLDKLKPLPEDAVAVIMREALLGLSFLWNKYDKFHRDLKAANILYAISGEVKLADFGCVRSLGDNTRMAHTYVGSPYWMAPEVIKNAPYDQMVDVWSLGITCIEIVTGHVPHYNKKPQLAMEASVMNPEPRLDEKYSREIKDFVVACVQKDPEKRKNIDQLMKLPFIRAAGDLKSWLPGKAYHLQAKRKDRERKAMNEEEE